MSELAFNMNGEPFDVPANATGWRVRRMKHKGAPEVVYGRDGLPLILPIEADIDDLRREVGTTGRYRLDPVEGHRPIPNASSGYVFVHDEQPAPVGGNSSTLPPPSDNIVIEAMRMNSEIARSVVDRFPQMLEAAATLLRAADGAGLPAREGRAVDDEGDDHNDHEEGEAPAGFDLNALVAQVVPMLIAGLASGKVKMPGLSAMLDWRKAAPAAPAKAARLKAREQTHDAVPEPINEDAHKSTVKHDDAALPPIDPETMAHFIAIQSALKPEEAAVARSVAAELSPAELRSWFDELKKLSVPQAVQKIRVLVAGNTEAVS